MTGVGSVTGAPMTPEVPVYAETAEQSVQGQIDETKDYLEGLAGVIRGKVHKVETVVLVEDKPDEAIIDFATKMHPTFIAMLRRSHPGIAEMLLGRVASKIVRSEVAPVLFVPTPSK
jgi:nucleotide-binding universal stress UspA family protein